MSFCLSARVRLVLVAGLCALLPGLANAAEPPVLNIYNWAEYLPDGMIAAFEKETGIKVRYDTYDSNEVLNAKLVAGKSGYDIVVPSANWAAIQIKAGLFQKLDRSKLTNWKNLDPTMLALLAQTDPDNQYLVDWAWGYTTVGINVEKVKAALGNTPMPDNAWALVFDPKYADKIKSCGISMLDSATEVFPAVLAYMGRDPYSLKAADYQDAAKVLEGVKNDIKVFSSSGYIDDMANGGLCMALGYSGDFNIAGKRAREAKAPYHVVPLIPNSGGLLFMDSMAIPADAPHPGNAMTFINFVLRPENAAAITNKMSYATMNTASIKLVSKEMVDNPTIFLGDADKKKLLPARTEDNDMRRIMTRLFTHFKSGI
jgi:putrescine transport system substrate-binding protein